MTVRKCAATVALTGSPAREPQQRGEKDLETLVVRRLVQGYRPRSGQKPSLEYVPLRCLGDRPAAQAGPPRFTVRSHYYGLGGSDELRTSPLCAQQGWQKGGGAGATSAPHQIWSGPPLAVLMLDGPSTAPSWSPGRPLTYLNVSRWPGDHGTRGVGLPWSVPWAPTAATDPLRILQIPYPSVGAWDGTRLQPEAPPLEARSALAAVFANGQFSDGWLVGRSPLRNLLLAECAAAKPGECLMMEAAGGNHTRALPGALGNFKDRDAAAANRSSRAVVEAYQHAVFCLQPWGDLSTRKGYWDALAAGCINAVFTESGWNETDAWYGRRGMCTSGEQIRPASVGPWVRHSSGCL